MTTIKAKDLKPGQVIELPDFGPDSTPAIVTISQIDQIAPHIVEISFYFRSRYFGELYYPEAEFNLLSE